MMINHGYFMVTYYPTIGMFPLAFAPICWCPLLRIESSTASSLGLTFQLPDSRSDGGIS